MRAATGAIVRVASCNFIEAYDFVVYGYYAGYIAAAFFPVKNSFTSLMLSLATFGVGYLMRPLGAIVLGAYMDRKGRKHGLILALALMAAGTLSIAVTPSYQSIGIVAPLIVIAGRLVQGFSAGAEFGGVAVYLSEIATPGNRGFYCSWQGVSQQVAVISAAVFGVVLTWLVPAEQMASWGWRIPLFAGLLALPLILWLRRSLQETETFRRSDHARTIREVLQILASNWKPVAIGIGLAAMTTCAFYLITAYTPTYAREALKLPANSVFVVTMLIGISNLVWLPIGGILSDRIGARPVMKAVTIATLATAYPAMLWLVAEPSTARLLAVFLIYSCYFGMYYGAMTPLLAEAMPGLVRATGYSFSFVTATAFLGGFTPAISTFLIQTSGNRAAPALWLSLAAALSLVSLWLLPELRPSSDRLQPAPAE